MGSDCISSWSLLIFLLTDTDWFITVLPGTYWYKLVYHRSPNCLLIQIGISHVSQVLTDTDWYITGLPATFWYSLVYHRSPNYLLDDGPDIKLFIFVGLGRSFFVCCLAHRGSTVSFLLLQCSSGVVRHTGDLRVSVATRSCRVLIFASSLYLSVIYLFPVVIHWWVRKPSRGPNNCMFLAIIEAEGEVGIP